MAYESTSAVKEDLERAKNTLSNLREKLESQVQIAKGTLEVGLSATVAGTLRGRFEDQADPDKYALFGIAPEIIGATIFHLVGFTRAAGRYSEDMHNLGNGLLAAFGFTKGIELGVEMREAAGKGGGTYTLGKPGVGVRGVRGRSRQGVRSGTRTHGVDADDMDGALERTRR